MATIKKRSGKYVVIYDYTDKEGVRKQKWETCETKSEAEKRAKQIEYDKSRDRFLTPSSQTVAEYFAEWVPIQARAKWQYKTYMGNMQMIEQHILPYIGHIEMQKLSPKDVDVLFDILRTKRVSGSRANGKTGKAIPYLSSTTRRHIYMILHSAMEKAVEWKIIEENPVICEAPQRSTKERAIWDAETLRQALDTVGDSLLHLALHFIFVGSLRNGEAMAMKWSDVDLDHKEVRVGKTIQRVDRTAIDRLPDDLTYFIFPSKVEGKKSVLILKQPKSEKSMRTVFLTDELCEELRRRKAVVETQKMRLGEKYNDFDLIFALPDGSPIEPNLIEKWFKKWQKTEGISLPSVELHGIRHASATYKLRLSNGDVKSVQGDTGHASAQMVTDLYAHILVNPRKKLCEALEEDFYKKTPSVTETQEAGTPTVDIGTLLVCCSKNPELKNQILCGLIAQEYAKM